MANPLPVTAGPWSICERDLAAAYIGKQIVATVNVPGGSDILIIARGDVASFEAPGNAAVIAGALEGLAAAKEVMSLLRDHGPAIVPHLMDSDQNAGQRLRDAIARAEGHVYG